MIFGTFNCTTSAAEKLPIFWVTVHRIQATETSENISNWKYSIAENSQITDSVTQDYICQKIGDDITVDRDDSFSAIDQ